MKYIFFILMLISDGFAIELKPIPLTIKLDIPMVKLGEKLFFDKKLSKNGKFSCNTCHKLSDNGASRTRYTKGANGLKGHFNVPTLYNAVFNFRQFWDGRAKNLIDQAFEPIINPIEMGNSIGNLFNYLNKNEEYQLKFNTIFSDGINKKNIALSLAEFEKSLITINSPFDKYLRGDKKALSKNALKGYNIFQEKGCISCHNGVNIGGNMYNKFGIYDKVKSTQVGRYNITHKEMDKYVFKVPSLRDIAITAPYMHDGRAKTLKDAINIMSKYQLGDIMDNSEVDALIAFLKSLTGTRYKVKNVSNH